MSNITNEAGTNGHTGALFEGLAVPADSAAALKRSKPQGTPREQSAMRNQVEWRACDLDSTLPADHQARAVWAFVQSLDLQALHGQIRAVEGSVGRAPIDPAILMSLWLYATLDGVGSARELGRLCDSDDAYRWLCGGVGVNHHTLGDFRVELNRVAHDGMRVRAQAGAASFRRRETLEQLMQDAQAQVQALKQEVGDDPGAGTRRVRAARQRAVVEREQRIARAIEAMAEIDKSLSAKGKKARANSTQADRAQDEPAQPQAAPTTQPVGEQCAEEQPNEARRAKKPKQPRVSTTDHEARVMKMADGGFRPAFNAQLAVDTATLIITGVDLINSGSDMNQMLPMHAQHQDRYGQVPAQWLTDGGFAQHAHIEELDARATQAFAPVVAPKAPQRDRYAALPGDSQALGQWRQRMGTEAAKRIYKERAASIECANARLRNRGLQRLNVRGMIKARAVLLWHALAHNLKRMMALNFAFAP
ncbi:transposase [Thiomonas sp. CB3]|nr:transposase [Thiomonas sp. CB3]